MVTEQTGCIPATVQYGYLVSITHTPGLCLSESGAAKLLMSAAKVNFCHCDDNENICNLNSSCPIYGLLVA